MGSDHDLAMQYEWNKAGRVGPKPSKALKSKDIHNHLSQMLGFDIDADKIFDLLIGNWVHQQWLMITV